MVSKQHVLLTQLYFTSTYLASPVHSHSLLGHFTWQDRIFLSVALSGNISCKETNSHLQSKLNNNYLAGKLKQNYNFHFLIKFWHNLRGKCLQEVVPLFMIMWIRFRCLNDFQIIESTRNSTTQNSKPTALFGTSLLLDQLN